MSAEFHVVQLFHLLVRVDIFYSEMSFHIHVELPSVSLGAFDLPIGMPNVRRPFGFVSFEGSFIRPPQKLHLFAHIYLCTPSPRQSVHLFAHHQ